ncbi:MAG: restriction endonuclease subunit S [Bacteroidetes bacterium]|jgi:type I restriction enzyme S subunit|nr:restriction endonuclease subunit S [Bacteroidota bacterium]
MKVGWDITKLGDVSQIINGGTPKSKVKNYWNGNINWITPADLGKIKSLLVDETPRKITELGLQKSSAKLFPAKSVILSTRAPIGHLAINTVPMATNQGCRGIVPNENLDTFFLYYFLKGNIELLNDLGTGTTFLELSTKNLSSVQIPLPPLPEQKRVVSILDRAFAAIDKAKANAKKNLQNAIELFESYLQGVFENQGEGWEEKKLGDVCQFENGDRGKNYPNKSHRVPEGIPFINAGHLANNEIDFSRMDYISEERFNLLGNGKVKQNDILFCLRGSLGKVANVGKLEKGAIASSLVILRAKEEINNDFLLYFLNSDLTINQIFDFGNGAAQPNLSAGSLKKFIIPLPRSKEEQLSIVQQLASVKEQTQRLETLYQKKIAALDELKKSILQKAFQGELETEKEFAL